MVSTTEVQAEVIEALSKIRGGKSKYAIIQLNDNNAVLFKAGDKDATFDTLKSDLQMDVPSYIVYNLTWTTDDSRIQNKILFINFVPDACSNMALKFSYANYKEAVKSKVNPINKELQINDEADLNEAEWIEDF